MSRPPMIRIHAEDLIVDNFAGGGGASEGIRLALGRDPDIAVNHDPEAIAMHAANHVAKKIPEEDVPDEEIEVGDFVKVLGTWRRVVRIDPYRGPYDFVVGIAETVPGGGFSLLRGSWTTRAKR